MTYFARFRESKPPDFDQRWEVALRHPSGAGALLWFLPLALSPAVGCGPLTDFGPPSIDGDQVVFHASSTPGGFPLYEAMYRNTGDCLGVIADRSTPSPGGFGTFLTFGSLTVTGEMHLSFVHGSPSFDAGEVAFWGVAPFGREGIFLLSGSTFSVVADRYTPLPNGSGNFAGFGKSPALRNGSVAFSSDFGIYLNDGSTIRRVMDRETSMPGLPDTVNYVHGGFSVGDDDVVAFTADIGLVAPTGVFVHDGASLRTVADSNTRVPGRPGTFGKFGRVSADGGDVVFVGGRPDPLAEKQGFGIYRDRGGTLSIVADTTTRVPRGFTNFDGFLDVATNGGDVDFLGTGGGREGIYRSSGGSLGVIVDRNTPIPGGTGYFSGLSRYSVDSSDNAFLGRGQNFQNGVYLYHEGSLSMIADRNTPIPRGSGNFYDFTDVATDGGEVAFTARSAGAEQSGIYLYSGSSLEVVVDRNTPIPPAGAAFFTGFPEVELDSGDIVFGAGSSGLTVGIYLYRQGSLSVIADGNTEVPGRPGHNFSFFTELTADSGRVTFIGHSAGFHQGVYEFDGISIQRVADPDVPFPGSTSNFSTVEYPWADEGSVAFVGSAPAVDGPEGVYRYDGNGIHVVADDRTAIPGGTGTFTRFGQGVSADGGYVLFEGGGSDPSGSQTVSGVYLANSEGSLSMVVDTQTAVPGGVGNFTSFDIGMESLDGADVVFLGKDEQLKSGVYLRAGGSLQVVADRNTPIPGGSGTFTGFEGTPALRDGNVAFMSHRPPGIYLYDGTVLKVVADTSTPIQPTCTSAVR